MAKKDAKQQAGSGKPAELQPNTPPVALDESFYTPVQKLRVTCTHEGFRRGGRAWSTTPTVVMSDEFTAVQLAQIKAEPRLTVEIIGSEGDVA